MDEGEGLGGRFWLWVVGVALAVGIGALLLFLLVTAAWARWGFLGAMIFFGALLLIFAWFWDRTHADRLE